MDRERMQFINGHAALQRIGASSPLQTYNRQSYTAALCQFRNSQFSDVDPA